LSSGTTRSVLPDAHPIAVEVPLLAEDVAVQPVVFPFDDALPFLLYDRDPIF